MECEDSRKQPDFRSGASTLQERRPCGPRSILKWCEATSRVSRSTRSSMRRIRRIDDRVDLETRDVASHHFKIDLGPQGRLSCRVDAPERKSGCLRESSHSIHLLFASRG